ncbi:hypothetical protein [Dactylosporangium sp. CA-233914]|uniref:hypothetical protein n=1 Tax=Dactylosporangium sp. CA-233914 TaxID=3239934 RepID=UPI003D8AFB68
MQTTTLPVLTWSGATAWWHELPRTLAAGAVTVLSAAPLATALLTGAPGWLAATATLPLTLTLTGLAALTADVSRADTPPPAPTADRSTGRHSTPATDRVDGPHTDADARRVDGPHAKANAGRVDGPRLAALRRVDPVLALLLSVAGLALIAPWGVVPAAAALLVGPYALAYGAVRGKRGLAALRGGVILAAYRPAWALTLTGLTVIGAFIAAASAGVLALAVAPLLLTIAARQTSALLSQIDALQGGAR